MEDQEYLNLFKKTQAENPSQWQNLNETPKYNQWENLNETPDLSKYQINENVNDGWGNLDIQIETRVNGVPQQQNPYYNPHVKRAKQVNNNDPNGLNQFLQSENLNEVWQMPKKVVEETLTIQQVQTGPVVENLQDVDVVSVELFNKINERAFMALKNTTVYNQMINS